MLSSGLRKVMKALLILLRPPGSRPVQTQLLRASVRRASPTSASFPPTSMPPCGRPPPPTMPSRSSSPRSMPTPWMYSSIASPRASRTTPTPSCCPIKPALAVPVGGAIHSIKSVYVPLFLMGCLEPTEVVEESRFSSYIQGLQRQRYAYSDHIGFSRARLSIVSRSEPVVVDADRLKLGLHRPHNHHHILDHRHCFHRHPLVHGLLRIPLPSPGGNTGDIQSGEQEARVVAHHRDRGGRRGHVGARFVRMEPIYHGPARGVRGRGHRPAVAVELPPSGQRRPARHVRYPVRQFRQPFGLESKRSRRARRCRDRS